MGEWVPTWHRRQYAGRGWQLAHPEQAQPVCHSPHHSYCIPSAESMCYQSCIS